MKKLLTILLTIPLIFGCGSSNEINPDPNFILNDEILGSWEVIEYNNLYLSGYVDPVFGFDIINDTIFNSLEDYEYGQQVIIFQYDNTYRFLGEHHFYSINNNTIQLVLDKNSYQTNTRDWDGYHYLNYMNLNIVPSTYLTVTNITDSIINYEIERTENTHIINDTNFILGRFSGSGILKKVSLK